jgi:hypothetical protein
MIEKAPDATNQSGLLAVNRASYGMRSELQAVEFCDFLGVISSFESGRQDKFKRAHERRS